MAGAQPILPHESDTQLRHDVDIMLSSRTVITLLTQTEESEGLAPIPPTVAQLLQAWRTLRPDQRYIIRGRYLGAKPVALAELGRTLGLSGERIRTRVVEIVNSLRRSLWAIQTGFTGLSVYHLSALRRCRVSRPDQLPQALGCLLESRQISHVRFDELEKWCRRRGYPSLIPHLPLYYREKFGL